MSQSTDEPTAYPLCWPQGHGRRPATQRKYGRFSMDNTPSGSSWRSTGPISIKEAMKRLLSELDHIGALNYLLSSNIPLLRNGSMRPSSDNPTDPGVALYFQYRGQHVAMPCDTYTYVAQNIAALAAHIAATRAIERHGVATIEAMFTGFTSIRGPGPKPWREVLGFSPGAAITRADIDTKRRTLAATHHPDRGGDPARMAEINAAADAALKEIAR